MSESISGTTSEDPLFNLDDEKTDWIRSACRRFRILIIGRANAGKTTILQKVCNTTELPVVYNTEGKEIDPVILEASASRGLHNIEDEMVFKSNPGFVFHDSRGFEAGGIEELNKVKLFIESRSKEAWLPNKLHAIWYCIPVDDSRPFTTAENWFFSECGTGEVPVIVIFTKFDALDTKAFIALRKEGKSRIEARELASQCAVSSFEEVHLETLSTFPYSPKGHVYLRNMNKEGYDCGDLVEQTAAALDDETLRQLFVSTQRNNLEVCIRYALESALGTIEQGIGKPIKIVSEDNFKEMIRIILRWFPQYSTDTFYLKLFSKPQRSNSIQDWIESAITIVILADFGFLLWDNYIDPSKAIDVYDQCPSIQAAIAEATNQAVQILISRRTWSRGKERLKKQMVQIALDNRLPLKLLTNPIVAGNQQE